MKSATFFGCVKWLFIFVAFPFFTTTMFFIGGLVLNYYQGLFVKWQPLEIPPEPPAKILSVNLQSIDIQTISGTVYTYKPDTSYWMTYDRPTGKWIKGRMAADQIEQSCNTEDTWISLAPPGKVIETHDFSWCPEIIVKVKYVLLEDGSIWRWSDPGTANGITILLIAPILGFVIGIILSFIIWLQEKNRRAM